VRHATTEPTYWKCNKNAPKKAIHQLMRSA